MKSRQLSIVLSLILVFGVTAGPAFAETHNDFDDDSMNDDSFGDDKSKDKR